MKLGYTCSKFDKLTFLVGNLLLMNYCSLVTWNHIPQMQRQLRFLVVYCPLAVSSYTVLYTAYLASSLSICLSVGLFHMLKQGRLHGQEKLDRTLLTNLL